MKRISGIWLSAAAAVFLFLKSVMISFAGSAPLTLYNPLGSGTSVSNVISSIGAFMLALAAPICGIMVIWGGFQMITAAGDPTKFSNGRKTLIYAAVGFVVVLFASSVVPILKSILGG